MLQLQALGVASWIDKRFLHQMVGALLSMAGAASPWALNLAALGEAGAATLSDYKALGGQLRYAQR
jgi:hypothetical protein